MLGQHDGKNVSPDDLKKGGKKENNNNNLRDEIGVPETHTYVQLSKGGSNEFL